MDVKYLTPYFGTQVQVRLRGQSRPLRGVFRDGEPGFVYLDRRRVPSADIVALTGTPWRPKARRTSR